MPLLQVFIAILLVGANGFFVAAEFAIVKVRRSRLEELEREGRRGARIARVIVENLDAYLSATQLGITLASLALGWIGEPVVAEILEQPFEALGVPQTARHSTSLVVAFAVITSAHIVVGELAPKSIAIMRAEATTLAVAVPLRLFYWAFFPFIWCMNQVARSLLRLVGLHPHEEATEEGYSAKELRIVLGRNRVLPKEDLQVMQRALSLPTRSVQEIMISRGNIVSLRASDTLDHARAIASSSGHNLFPVTAGSDADSVMGIVSLRDVLNARLQGLEIPVGDLAEPPRYVPQTAAVPKVVHALRRDHVRMAVVVDEHGGVAGLITLADVLQDMLGPVPDDGGRLSAVPAEGTEVIDGTKLLRELAEELGVPLQGRQPITVAGYILEQLERIPRPGEKTDLGTHVLVVEAVQGPRITLVRVVSRS